MGNIRLLWIIFSVLLVIRFRFKKFKKKLKSGYAETKEEAKVKKRKEAKAASARRRRSIDSAVKKSITSLRVSLSSALETVHHPLCKAWSSTRAPVMILMYRG